MAKTWTYNKEDGNYSDEEGNIYIIRAGRPIKISSVKKEEEKEEDYKMTHRPDNDWHMTPDDLLGEDSVAPKDVYEHPEYYTIHSNKNVVKETKEALEKVKGNPDAKITIYRATTGDTINDGDWITLSKSYAEDHNYSQLDGKGKVISKEVPVKDVEWAGDDLSEWGYFPKGKDPKIIYHAGDLGIGRDTTYANMTNQSRGTGHFGTGTYFVSSQDELQHGTYKDRPIKAVDISDYNLYKPKNSVEAEHLHDFLKEINNTKWDSEERYSKLVEGKKEYDNLYDDIIKKNNWTYDFSQEDYKKMNDKLEAIFKDSDCYYENREEFTNSYDYRNADPKDEGWYNQFLEEKYNDLKDYLYSESNQWKRIKENVSSQISNDDINKGLEAVKKEYEKYKGIPTYTLMGQKQDSLSTTFMKSLGYEGVDVSGIKDFDNVTYGSVIYNLKNDHEDYSNLKSFESIGEKYNGPTNMYLNRYISLGQTGQTNENTMKIIKSNIENLKIEAPEDITLYHGGKPDENIEDSLILSTSVSKRVAHLYGRNISKIEIKKGDPIISTYNAQYDRFREIPEEHTHWKNRGEIVLVPSMGNFKEIAPGVFAFIKK